MDGSKGCLCERTPRYARNARASSAASSSSESAQLAERSSPKSTRSRRADGHRQTEAHPLRAALGMASVGSREQQAEVSRVDSERERRSCRARNSHVAWCAHRARDQALALAVDSTRKAHRPARRIAGIFVPASAPVERKVGRRHRLLEVASWSVDSPVLSRKAGVEGTNGRLRGRAHIRGPCPLSKPFSVTTASGREDPVQGFLARACCGARTQRRSGNGSGQPVGRIHPLWTSHSALGLAALVSRGTT